MKVHFPKDVGQKYYNAHYKFLFNILEFMNLDIELCNPEPRPAGGFILRIDEKRIMIDFTDFLTPVEETDNIDACFKYHYTKEYCGQNNNIHPLGTISFHDWADYFKLGEVIKYKCNTDRILNNQKARHGAKHRRRDVQKLLESKYANLVDTEISNRVEFWMKVSSCLVSVCVPGQRNDILDRGQFQYMAFGACTISPKLSIVLPYMKDVLPRVHYVECTSDYSDLIEKIEWCKEHRSECIQIGQNAKSLFSETSTPSAIWQWMCMVLKENNGTKP